MVPNEAARQSCRFPYIQRGVHDPGNRVRIRLAAGGEWIRTSSSARDRQRFRGFGRVGADRPSASRRAVVYRRMKAPTLLAVARHRGTGSSNPFPSSGESCKPIIRWSSRPSEISAPGRNPAGSFVSQCARDRRLMHATEQQPRCLHNVRAKWTDFISKRGENAEGNPYESGRASRERCKGA